MQRRGTTRYPTDHRRGHRHGLAPLTPICESISSRASPSRGTSTPSTSSASSQQDPSDRVGADESPTDLTFPNPMDAESDNARDAWMTKFEDEVSLRLQRFPQGHFVSKVQSAMLSDGLETSEKYLTRILSYCDETSGQPKTYAEIWELMEAAFDAKKNEHELNSPRRKRKKGSEDLNLEVGTKGRKD